jgi:hypothetical protein
MLRNFSRVIINTKNAVTNTQCHQGTQDVKAIFSTRERTVKNKN